MSIAPHPEPREEPDPNYRPLLDSRPFFIETRSGARSRRGRPLLFGIGP